MRPKKQLMYFLNKSLFDFSREEQGIDSKLLLTYMKMNEQDVVTDGINFICLDNSHLSPNCDTLIPNSVYVFNGCKINQGTDANKQIRLSIGYTSHDLIMPFFSNVSSDEIKLLDEDLSDDHNMIFKRRVS